METVGIMYVALDGEHVVIRHYPYTDEELLQNYAAGNPDAIYWFEEEPGIYEEELIMEVPC